MENQLLRCDCNSCEHHIVIVFDEDFSDNYREVIFEYHLASRDSFFERCLYAFKYIFGYKCKFGAWDELIITKNNYEHLKKVVQFIENDNG